MCAGEPLATGAGAVAGRGGARRSVRIANEAWEALFRAQGRLLHAFEADDIWQQVSLSEYDVLYTLAKEPHGLSMGELNTSVMLTQPTLSRLVERMVGRGLVGRERMPHDSRRVCVTLTAEGHRVQRIVGRRHARLVADRLTASLSDAELEQLRDLAARLARSAAEDGEA
ncbi:MarR family transcriptional regulator [Pseudoclavibacter sp. CFCC 13796]|uniref:MarR family winged helix-turn-helix transcriptional regulator n=1 Tax=Pseudoclavibacter sp. CFCC 13796 TaxID=2615179 RepID=UPI0013013D74|nr:MarR family transcriptional regulator [Pseudoclavibacter sp. CFCC 13796]KAB1661435.1 MarR family transcriptional regulator [Pseudoclavibacter sp. CFCC 13796]